MRRIQTDVGFLCLNDLHLEIHDAELDCWIADCWIAELSRSPHTQSRFGLSRLSRNTSKLKKVEGQQSIRTKSHWSNRRIWLADNLQEWLMAEEHTSPRAMRREWGGGSGEEAGPQTVSPERVCHLATAASPSLSLALVHRKLLLIAPPLCSSAYIQWSCDAINQWFAMICVEWLLLLLLEEERRLPADSVWGHLGDCHCPLLVMCIYILVQ